MGTLKNIVVLAALVALLLAGQKAWIYYYAPATNLSRTAADPKESQRQVDRCVNDGNTFTPDESISGCTAAVQSGRWSGQDLAAVFLNRGKALSNKGDLDRAIADFNEAIRLNPNDATFANVNSNHAGGVNCLMADGSVRFVKSSINQYTWWSLGTRAGGEVISADSY